MDSLEQQKLDAMKELAYGASHEINNPLANIAARAQSLLRDETHPERRRSLEAIHQQAMRAHEMISDLMLFARPPQIVPQSFDLVSSLQEIKQKLTSECQPRNIEIRLELPDADCAIEADEKQLTVAILAVCQNAVEAIRQNGELRILLKQVCSEIGTSTVTVEVCDTGPGISERVRPHLFDPFFSGREAGRGLGFGLSKCWRIMHEHGGDVSVANLPEGGARVTLHLPLPCPANLTNSA